MSKNFTVNELLVIQTNLNKRLNQLTSLIAINSVESVTKTTYGDGEIRTDTKTNRYDPVDLEKKCAEINFALFEIDRLIKVSNAKTKVKITLDLNALMSPIEPKNWK